MPYKIQHQINSPVVLSYHLLPEAEKSTITLNKFSNDNVFYFKLTEKIEKQTWLYFTLLFGVTFPYRYSFGDL